MNRREAVKKVVAACVATVATMSGRHSLAETREPDHHTVEIKGFKFDPPTLLVKQGDTVTWVNRDFVPHTASALDDSWDTGELLADESGEVVIGDGSGMDYFCRHHPSMTGKLVLS